MSIPYQWAKVMQNRAMAQSWLHSAMGAGTLNSGFAEQKAPPVSSALPQAATNQSFVDPVRCIGGPLDGHMVEGKNSVTHDHSCGNAIAAVRYHRARLARGGQTDGYDVFLAPGLTIEAAIWRTDGYDVFLAEGLTIEAAICRLIQGYGRVGVAAPTHDWEAEKRAMATQIEVLSYRLGKEHDRAHCWQASDRESRELLDECREELSAAHAEISRLRAKLPPEPPAPPSAGESIAHCLNAIFPLER